MEKGCSTQLVATLPAHLFLLPWEPVRNSITKRLLNMLSIECCQSRVKQGTTQCPCSRNTTRLIQSGQIFSSIWTEISILRTCLKSFHAPSWLPRTYWTPLSKHLSVNRCRRLTGGTACTRGMVLFWICKSYLKGQKHLSPLQNSGFKSLLNVYFSCFGFLF